MTITRVQQVSGVLTGTSDTITLPAQPQYGNTLIAVLVRAGIAPVATSLTQTNVTWSPGLQGHNSSQIAHQLFYAQRVEPLAGQTITVTRGDSDSYLIVVLEYAGLRTYDALVDRTVTNSSSGHGIFTNQTALTNQADELFLAAMAHVDSTSLQGPPTDLFTEIVQLSEAPVDPTAAYLGVYEKIVDATGQPHTAVDTDYVVWNARLVTFYASATVLHSEAVGLDSYIADEFNKLLDLDVLVADETTRSADLDISIATILHNELQILITGPGILWVKDLDVVVAEGHEEVVYLDVYFIIPVVSPRRAVKLDCRVSTVPLTTPEEERIGPSPVRKTTRLDVAVLRPQPVNRVITTPEDYRYLSCRTLWCNVPSSRAIEAELDVTVGGVVFLRPTLNFHVADVFYRQAFLQVFIAPEP
jgi:hypothetical protein